MLPIELITIKNVKDGPGGRGRLYALAIYGGGLLALFSLCLLAAQLPHPWSGRFVGFSTLLVVGVMSYLEYQRQYGPAYYSTTASVDDGGLRVEVDESAFYVPLRAVRVTLDRSGEPATLAGRTGLSRFSLSISGEASRRAASQVRERARVVAAWRCADATLAKRLERGGRKLHAWSTDIARMFPSIPGAGPYRDHRSADDAALLGLLQDIDAPITVRAGAAYALLSRTPTDAESLSVVLAATTPPLVIAMAAAATLDPRVHERYESVARFLSWSERNGIGRLRASRLAR